MTPPAPDQAASIAGFEVCGVHPARRCRLSGGEHPQEGAVAGIHRCAPEPGSGEDLGDGGRKPGGAEPSRPAGAAVGAGDRHLVRDGELVDLRRVEPESARVVGELGPVQEGRGIRVAGVPRRRLDESAAGEAEREGGAVGEVQAAGHVARQGDRQLGSARRAVDRDVRGAGDAVRARQGPGREPTLGRHVSLASGRQVGAEDVQVEWACAASIRDREGHGAGRRVGRRGGGDGSQRRRREDEEAGQHGGSGAARGGGEWACGQGDERHIGSSPVSGRPRWPCRDVNGRGRREAMGSVEESDGPRRPRPRGRVQRRQRRPTRGTYHDKKDSHPSSSWTGTASSARLR